MADIATLGIAVDSSQADKGAVSLQKLSGAARMAEQATKGVSSGAHAAAQANAAVSSSATAAASALTKQAGAARMVAVAVNDNAGRMSNSFSGLAAQFQDIGVTAAMGMNPAIIALQQGTQIAGQMEMAMQGGASATSVLGTAFKSLFSPLTFVTIALTALAAAGLQMVDWPQLAASALTAFANVLETITPYAVAAAGALALLYSPSIIMGITQVIALLGRMAVAAVSAGIAMAAANPAGAFILGVTAAVAAANIFRDELARIFGRDIVADAKNAVNFVIGAFVGAFNAIKATWSALPSAIGDLVYSAANAVVGGVEAMINKVAGLIDGFIAKINSAVSSLPFGMGEGVNIGSIGTVDLGGVSNPFAGAASDAANAVSKAMSDAQGSDYVGAVTEAIARGASAASDKLKELAGWITTVDEKDKKKKGKTDAEKYSDIVAGANRRIATLKAEQAALGLTDLEATKLAYTTDLLNEAQQKGITLTAAQKAELEGLAGTMASIEVATKAAKDAMEFAKDVTRGFMDDMRSGLEQGKSFWESFGNAALGVLDKITDKLLNDVLDALFQVNNAGGGGGGILGSILGALGLGGGGFSAKAYAGIGQGLYADGGYTGAGGKYEPAGVVHKGEYVFSAAAVRAIGLGNLHRAHRSASRGFADGGFAGGGISRVHSPANGNGGESVRVEVEVYVNDDGTLGAIARTAGGQAAEVKVRQGLAGFEKSRQKRYQAGGTR